MKILAIYDKSGPKYHRILMPVHMLQETYGFEVKVAHVPTEEEFAWSDIVFFNRLIAGVNIKKIIDYREKYGFVLINDLDDHWVLDRSHLLYKSYKEGNVSRQIEAFVKAADVVTVTHERLHYEVTAINDNCHILPNAIAKTDQFLQKKIPDEKTRLFWAGGITHKNDLELLRRPLQLIKRESCKFIIAGYKKREPEWKEMAKIFTTNSSYNTHVIESLDVHEYYKAYALCDISLVPLQVTSFNIHKSNLKILEAANIGAPVIVSKVHPYLGFPEDIVNYVDVHNTWYSQINKLLKDPVLREEQGALLQEYCDEHYNFEKINLERKQIFEYVKSCETTSSER